jgi:hypothetical protein
LSKTCLDPIAQAADEGLGQAGGTGFFLRDFRWIHEIGREMASFDHGCTRRRSEGEGEQVPQFAKISRPFVREETGEGVVVDFDPTTRGELGSEEIGKGGEIFEPLTQRREAHFEHRSR